MWNKGNETDQEQKKETMGRRHKHTTNDDGTECDVYDNSRETKKKKQQTTSHRLFISQVLLVPRSALLSSTGERQSLINQIHTRPGRSITSPEGVCVCVCGGRPSSTLLFFCHLAALLCIQASSGLSGKANDGCHHAPPPAVTSLFGTTVGARRKGVCVPRIYIAWL